MCPLPIHSDDLGSKPVRQFKNKLRWLTTNKTWEISISFQRLKGIASILRLNNKKMQLFKIQCDY